MNASLTSKHKQKIEGRRLINGITNAALDSISFLSSASFQETINIITWSGLIGSEDDLRSIKSSIISGTIIKAGTGFALDMFNKMANELKSDENNV
jgi:DNA-directed RNA polymerase subunit beta'